MRYMLTVPNDERVPLPADWEASVGPVELVNDEMRATGVWVFGGGLMPSDNATVVHVRDGATTTTDGPFAETKEQLGGFWVIDVADLDEAQAWAAKCAAVCGGRIEVRPFDHLSQS